MSSKPNIVLLRPWRKAVREIFIKFKEHRRGLVHLLIIYGTLESIFIRTGRNRLWHWLHFVPLIYVTRFKISTDNCVLVINFLQPRFTALLPFNWIRCRLPAQSYIKSIDLVFLGCLLSKHSFIYFLGECDMVDEVLFSFDAWLWLLLGLKRIGFF